MNSLFKHVALAAVLSLSLAGAAKAGEVVSDTPSGLLPGDKPQLIARRDDQFMMFFADPKDPFYDLAVVDEAISNMMAMAQAGVMASQSSNPELRAMGLAMVEHANAELEKLNTLRKAILDAQINKKN